MILKTIFQLAFVLALPISVISCGDEKKDEETSKGEASEKTHIEIGKEIGVVMDSLMSEMAAIKDVQTAKEFSSGLPAKKEALRSLLAEAKSLDPPTAEEKAAAQKLKVESDAKGDVLMGGFMKMMADSPDAEAIGEELGKIMNDTEMTELTDELEEIYELKDDAGGAGADSK